VIGERIEDPGQEWRAFSKEENEGRSRAGAPLSLAMHDMGLATVISPRDRDASGRPLKVPMRGMIQRLRMWDSRNQVHESVDRNLRCAFNELDALAGKLGVSRVIAERAAYIYRKALERGLTAGRSTSGLTAAALYAACRALETPRTLKDIAEVSGLKKKDVAKFYRLLVRELDLRMPIVDPTKSVGRVASKAGLSERIQRRAVELLRKASEMRISTGKEPMGMAAAALYIACVLENEKRTQKELAEVAGVTEITVRKHCRELNTALGIEKPLAAT
jgi:transcription initiation factor TFIIB